MQVVAEKQYNLDKAARMIAQAAGMGARLVVLPEVFNGPYDSSLFSAYAETVPGSTFDFLAQSARRHGIVLVGGSFIERAENNQIYNTSYIFDAEGNVLGHHRKIHLFDVDIPGQITFQESSVLSSGQDITVVDHEDMHIGLMICYDVRFPELARAMTLKGADLLVIPAGFNRTTGPLHWELLMRSRAVDNQVFVLAAGSAFNPDSSYQAWGHSMIVDPWGKIIAQTGDEENIVLADLDFSIVEQVRRELPLLKHRKEDIYQLNYK
jgi:predicted amidohydrolase